MRAQAHPHARACTCIPRHKAPRAQHAHGATPASAAQTARRRVLTPESGTARATRRRCSLPPASSGAWGTVAVLMRSAGRGNWWPAGRGARPPIRAPPSGTGGGGQASHRKARAPPRSGQSPGTAPTPKRRRASPGAALGRRDSAVGAQARTPRGAEGRARGRREKGRKEATDSTPLPGNRTQTGHSSIQPAARADEPCHLGTSLQRHLATRLVVDGHLYTFLLLACPASVEIGPTLANSDARSAQPRQHVARCRMAHWPDLCHIGRDWAKFARS